MKSLLVIDDCQAMRQCIKRVVRGFATEIHECSNGVEAFSAIAQHVPDCVLMDVQMPGMDGIELTALIKGCFPSTRVVVVTGHDFPHIRTAAFKAGASDFVAKDNLLALRQVLSREPSDAPAFHDQSIEDLETKENEWILDRDATTSFDDVVNLGSEAPRFSLDEDDDYLEGPFDITPDIDLSIPYDPGIYVGTIEDLRTNKNLQSILSLLLDEE